MHLRLASLVLAFLALSLSASPPAGTSGPHTGPPPTRPQTATKFGSEVTQPAKPAAPPKVTPQVAEDLEASAPGGEAPAQTPVAAETAPPVAEPTPSVPPPPPPVAESGPPPAPPTDPLQLVDAFSVDQNPGTGTLDYTAVGGTPTERITLGPTTGLYGMAMLFKSATLPDVVARDFKGLNVIQLALGTVRGRLTGQISQFSTATILLKSYPKTRTAFPLIVPSGREPSSKPMGLLLFASPATPNEQSDEDKLKGTYFAQGGRLFLTLKDRARVIDVKAQGKRLPFKMQVLEVEMDAELATPFNAQENRLTGKIEVPLYWPEGKAGEAFLRRIARESFGAASGVSIPENLESGRDVAGEKKKDAPRKNLPTRPKGM